MGYNWRQQKKGQKRLSGREGWLAAACLYEHVEDLRAEMPTARRLPVDHHQVVRVRGGAAALLLRAEHVVPLVRIAVQDRAPNLTGITNQRPSSEQEPSL